MIREKLYKFGRCRRVLAADKFIAHLQYDCIDARKTAREIPKTPWPVNSN